MPVGIAARRPGAMVNGRIGRHRGEEIEAGGVFALVGRQRQIAGVRQPQDPELDLVHWLRSG